jgi:uncharacterized protein
MVVMNRSIAMRLLAAGVLIAAEIAAATALLVVAPEPAGAQRFEDFFPFFQQKGRRSWFAPPERDAPPLDYSKAPAPKKADAVPQTPIMVFGDSMADWLAYGLEQAFTDSPEIGILRRHRTSSGLIRTEVRNDPRGEYPDWPVAAKEMIAAQKPKFVVMMIGLNDRKQIREVVQPVRPKPAVPAAPGPIDPASRELDGGEPRPAPEAAATAPEVPAGPGGIKTYEFRSDAWSEAYIRRIDDTIAALKTAGVPIFWVGLPGRARGGRHPVPERSLPQPRRQGWHCLRRRLGRLRRRGWSLRPVRSRLRRPDAPPARGRRRLLHPGRGAQARPFR